MSIIFQLFISAKIHDIDNIDSERVGEKIFDFLFDKLRKYVFTALLHITRALHRLTQTWQLVKQYEK